MRSILQQIPESSYIHLVCCNSLQKSYFGKRSFDALKQNTQPLKKARFYRIRKYARKLGNGADPALVEIQGMKNESTYLNSLREKVYLLHVLIKA